MLLILPAFAFALFFEIFRRANFDWRKAILTAAIFWGTSVTLITEMLSIFEEITPQSVAEFWIAICAVALVWLVLRKNLAGLAGSDDRISSPGSGRLDTEIKIMLGLAILVVALVAIVAILAPPSSWDAMQTYLPRVMLWISNRSVKFYPTPDYLQLIYAPWPSYAMMHSILLFGSDRFVNLIQTLSLVGSAIAVSLIAKHIGAEWRGQALAAIVSVTIPQGVIEASGVLNSYVVSFWIATTVAYLLIWKQEASWFNTICVGLAAGLALLSKGHAYIFLPFLVLSCWWMGTWSSRISFLKSSAVFVLGILVINAPTYIRNYELTSSPLGLPLPEPFRQSMMMDEFSASEIAANTLRHLSAHIGSPFDSLNKAMTKATRSAIQKLGVDPDKSIYDGDTFEIHHASTYEVFAGNPLHLALMVLSFAAVFLNWKRRIPREAALYSLGISLSFILMSATIIWQTTTSRYHLPLFVLGAATTGLVLEKYIPRKLGATFAFLLLAFAIFSAAANRTRSLIPYGATPTVYLDRPQLYFADFHESSFPAHTAAAAAINKSSCTDVGIDSVLPKGLFRDSKGSLFVYPIFALIDPSGRSRSLRYTGVHNLTLRYATNQTDPCAVICFNCSNLPEKWKEYQRIGGRASVFDNIVVFSRDGDQINSL